MKKLSYAIMMKGKEVARAKTYQRALEIRDVLKEKHGCIIELKAIYTDISEI